MIVARCKGFALSTMLGDEHDRLHSGSATVAAERGDHHDLPLPDSPAYACTEDNIMQKYSIDFMSYLGRGAFGLTFSVTDRATGEQLAIKVCDTSQSERMSSTRREAQIMENLRGNRHVIEIRAHGSIAPSRYGIVMELASGGEVSLACANVSTTASSTAQSPVACKHLCACHLCA